MEFPFQVGIHDQQTQKIKDHIGEFYSGDLAPKVEHTFTNKKGEKRRVLRFFLPRGCRTVDTIYDHRKGGTFYHTPLAKGDGELGSVLYEEIDDNGKVTATASCDSQSWLKWASDADIVSTPNPAPEPNPIKAAYIKMGKKAMDAREEAGMKSELSKEAVFTPVRTRVEK